MSLHDLQRNFAAGLLNGNAEAIAAHLRPGRFGAERHLNIYRNNVYASLTAALEAVYPVIARLVGADCFRGCASAYIRRSPPTGGNLHTFGGGFGDFLGDFEPVRELAYLTDVAHLEWSYHCAFHAADVEPLAFDALAHVPAERYAALRFRLHPSAHLLASEYPLLKIWSANQSDTPHDEIIDLDEGGTELLIIRRGIHVVIEGLTGGEYALLHAFARRQALREAAAEAATADRAFDLKLMLHRRVHDQTIAGFELGQ